jgi:hypothetical protein
MLSNSDRAAFSVSRTKNMQTLLQRPQRKILPDGEQQPVSPAKALIQRPTLNTAAPMIAPAAVSDAAPVKAVRPTPTFAAPVLAPPVVEPEIRAQRPIPQLDVPYQPSAREIAEENYNAAASRVMVDKDKNPILNALKGFGIRFLQSKGGFWERLGGGAVGAIENTALRDANGNRGTMDERFMQAQRTGQAKSELDRLTAQEQSALERAGKQIDLQNKVLRPFQEQEKIRTKDDATTQRAQAAQARIDSAVNLLEIKLGAAVKPIASQGKMWQIVNKPDSTGKLVPSLQPLIDPETNQQLDDPKTLEIQSRESIASGRNATSIKTAEIRAGASKYSADSNAQIRREQLGAQLKEQIARRNISTAQLKAKLDAMVSKGDLSQNQADAAYADATSNTLVSNKSQAAQTIEAIKRQGAESGKTPAEIAAKVQEFVNSLPKAVRPK